MAKKTAKINAGSVDALIKLFGSCDENINMIRENSVFRAKRKMWTPLSR